MFRHFVLESGINSHSIFEVVQKCEAILNNVWLLLSWANSLSFDIL